MVKKLISDIDFFPDYFIQTSCMYRYMYHYPTFTCTIDDQIYIWK